MSLLRLGVSISIIADAAAAAAVDDASVVVVDVVHNMGLGVVIGVVMLRSSSTVVGVGACARTVGGVSASSHRHRITVQRLTSTVVRLSHVSIHHVSGASIPIRH